MTDEELHTFARECAAHFTKTCAPDKKHLRFNEIVRVAVLFCPPGSARYPTSLRETVQEYVLACFPRYEAVGGNVIDNPLYDKHSPQWKYEDEHCRWMLG